ncbi:hypothetical protein [Devosia sp. CN2-171]|uniref:hypothetical protein n=1 Tax=Devosia sp. CN2-171 TaxID=3400909 RepID=UPI003BF8D7CD
MKSLNFGPERYSTATTDAPHELAAAVNLIEKAGLLSDDYDYAFWLRKVKEARFDHPEEQVRLLIEKMLSTKAWLLSKRGEAMNCGGWLTNRLKEQANGP